MASRKSFSPENTADSGMNRRPLWSASKRASVVLPVPGAPQRIIDGSSPLEFIRRRNSRPSPTRWVCPTNSERERGRILSASGAAPSLADCGVSVLNRLLDSQASIMKKSMYNYRRKDRNRRLIYSRWFVSKFWCFIGQNMRNLQRNAAAENFVYLAADDKADKFGGIEEGGD